MSINDKNSAGYTLIELLIVVTIISILLAIAIPQYMAHRDKAKMATVYSTLYQIRLVQEAYKTSKKVYFDLGDAIITQDDSPVLISDTGLELYIPSGQAYQIKTELGTETDKYKVTIQTDFDRDLDGSKDFYLYESDTTKLPLSPVSF